jgi:RND family efflux transporter MFP subunit
MNTEKTANTNGRIIFRITVCFAILLAGVATMLVLIWMKKPPVEVAVDERALRVKTLSVTPENVEVRIAGFGQVQVLNKVSISAEVAGRIVYTHPRLEQGEIVEKNATLFQIDPSDYIAARDSARADVERTMKQIQLIKKRLKLDSERLKNIERNRELAKVDYERQRRLYNEEEVGSLSNVEKLERAYNAAFDLAAQMAKAVDLYPLQIEEAENSLISANSRLASAEKNLTRCDVKAAFTGRLAEVSVEIGQYVSPGQPLLTLADDSTLEIPVPIDSIEAGKWLRFKPGKTNGWLQDVEPVECEIRWTEDNKSVWKGRLHRVMKFDPDTRTLTVVIRINEHRQGISGNNQLPLVDGMFCSISIPGRIMNNVYRLPRWAVSFKKTVFLAVNDRLKTVRVEVENTQGEETFVSKGLKEGDRVIITRLVAPLENSLLEIL